MDEPHIPWQFIAWYFAIGFVCAFIALNWGAESKVDQNGRTRMYVTDMDLELALGTFFLWPFVIVVCVCAVLVTMLEDLQVMNNRSINWHPIRWFRKRYHPFEWFFLWPAHLREWIECRIDNYRRTHEAKKHEYTEEDCEDDYTEEDAEVDAEHAEYKRYLGKPI